LRMLVRPIRMAQAIKRQSGPYWSIKKRVDELYYQNTPLCPDDLSESSELQTPRRLDPEVLSNNLTLPVDLHETMLSPSRSNETGNIDTSLSTIRPRSVVNMESESISFNQALKKGNPIVIAVMGTTGSGKSTFIQRATGWTEGLVGNGLSSCMSFISRHLMMHDPSTDNAHRHGEAKDVQFPPWWA
jgi:hypothetical protein